MIIVIAEFIGSAIFIFLTSVCMLQVKQFAYKDMAAKLFEAFGFASVWTMVSYIFGTSSGAHFSIAISTAFGLTNVGIMVAQLIPYYVAAQVVGAFIGCILFSIIYRNKIINVIEEDDYLEVFTNNPKDEAIIFYALKEFIISFLLIFAIRGVGMVWGISGGLNYFYLFIIVLCLGLTVADYETYSVTLIRDIPCKIVVLLFNIKNKNLISKIKWQYSIIALVFSIFGAILASYAFNLIPWPTL